MSIKLSPKHGVNPTMGRCMWCGEPTNEIAMLGKLKGDKEAPRYSVLSYEPCDKCKEIWKQGVALIECTPNEFEDGRPPFTKDSDGVAVYPTGHLFVIRPEPVSTLFNRECKAGDVIAIDDAVYSMLQSMFEASKDEKGGEDSELDTVSDDNEDN